VPGPDRFGQGKREPGMLPSARGTEKPQASGGPGRGTAPPHRPPHRTAPPCWPSTSLTPQAIQSDRTSVTCTTMQVPAKPQSHRVHKGVRIGDSAAQDSREVIAAADRSQARCASTRQESRAACLAATKKNPPRDGWVRVPSAESRISNLLVRNLNPSVAHEPAVFRRQRNTAKRTVGAPFALRLNEPSVSHTET
jgi:hypothetical protein